jgi:membrane protease YdiL (CAAX protease family)
MSIAPAVYEPRLSPGEALRCVAFFVAIYLSILVVGGKLVGSTYSLMHEVGLVAAVVATAASIGLLERGKWDLGLRRSPSVISSSITGGFLVAAGIIVAADGIIRISSDLIHQYRGLFPFGAVATLILPAAVHEELLFRGYPFQKMLAWRPAAAVLFGSAIFSILHLGNDSVSMMGLANIFMAGLLLSAGYLATRTLWFPMAMHVTWNVLTGPVLGYEVSGFGVDRSLFGTLRPPGPLWITGGAFGIEGSAILFPLEAAATIFLLLLSRRTANRSPADIAPAPEYAPGDQSVEMEK